MLSSSAYDNLVPKKKGMSPVKSSKQITNQTIEPKASHKLLMKSQQKPSPKKAVVPILKSAKQLSPKRLTQEQLYNDITWVASSQQYDA